MRSNFRPNIRIATNILIIISTFSIFETMHIFLRNIRLFICFSFLSLNFNSYSYAHMRGTFLSKEEAEKRALELGCEEIHKNQDKWMPCKNEKELHIYLRK